MENNELVTIPYVVHRDMVAHDRWIIKRLIVALIICIALIFLSNGMWLYVWQQYDYGGEETEVVTTVDSEGDGIANYTGGNGGVSIGEGDSPQDYENEK